MEAKNKKNFKIWLVIVLLLAILLRVGLFLTYPAVSYSDTFSYRRSADAILGGFQHYDGTRTPGYPAFMALLGPDRAVYAVQLILGLGITLFWFVIGWKASGRPFIGALAALAHTLNPGQFFFEATLLSETLSTFWLVLSLLGAFRWLDNPKHRSIWLGLGIGIVSSLAVLTRPVFIFMPVWLAVFLGFSFTEKKIRVDWKPLVSILLVAVFLVGGWMTWIKSHYKVFSLSAMTGYHLVQHTGYYFEDVPDKFGDIRDVYLRYRDARIEERGTQGNAIWDAIPAIMSATGYSFYELSRILQNISIQLILTHPWEYLVRVLRGWWLFWRAPVYWDVTAISPSGLSEMLRSVILGARGLLFGMNLVFILTSIGALVSKRLRQIWALVPFHWLLAGAIWATSVLSSILDHGDNPRFLVPLQTAVVFWVLWIGIASRHFWRARRIAGRLLE
jgi:4-amino-4-deoxy-L-arabinose transferase-like glycosyltransferase